MALSKIMLKRYISAFRHSAFVTIDETRRIFTQYMQNIRWNTLPKAKLVREVNLCEWGGDELFLCDVNNDGYLEFVWLQSKGVFKSDIYLQSHSQLVNEDSNLFCITVTNQQGKVLWQYGQAHTSSIPYGSHAAERILTFFDIDNDGYTEILALTKDELLILDANEGKVKEHLRLPGDNFGIVTCAQQNKFANIILVSVMADSYTPYEYANPTLFINQDLEILRIDSHKGSGHRILIDDFNYDGQEEALIGYQLVALDGTPMWTLDVWKNKAIDSFEQHVDHVEAFEYEGNPYFAIAGSDQLYLTDAYGRTIWKKKTPHPQYCLVGSFCKSLVAPQIFLMNSRGSMSLFDFEGNELWNTKFPQNWPQGKPRSVEKHFHMGQPATVLRQRGQDIILYYEAGWPYGVDGEGKPCLVFPPTDRAKKPEYSLPTKHRPDDYGMGYKVQVADIDNDGENEIIVYDRRYAWIYKKED